MGHAIDDFDFGLGNFADNHQFDNQWNNFGFGRDSGGDHSAPRGNHLSHFDFGPGGKLDHLPVGNKLSNFDFGGRSSHLPIGNFLGSHFILGDAGDNVLTGNDFSNILIGRGGNDTLIGKGGLDFLIGGRGNDNLEGDRGSDIYTFGPGRDAALCVVNGSAAAAFIRDLPNYEDIVGAAQQAYEAFGFGPNYLDQEFVDGGSNGPTFEFFNDFKIGEDSLDITTFVPWLFTVAGAGVFGPVGDVNNDGTIAEADILLTLIDQFLGNTMTFYEAQSQGLIPPGMEFSLHALGLKPGDAVFLPNQIGADEIFAFKGVSPADFQAQLFNIFNFGLTPQDFANFGLSAQDLIDVGAAHGVTFDLSAFA